ncbi:MAG: hypothetical protein RIM23_16080 [Coleofasciculus sp. G3-WIS-01]
MSKWLYKVKGLAKKNFPVTILPSAHLLPQGRVWSRYQFVA